VRLEIADIFRLHGPDYREKYGERMLASHLKAMEDIERCRTEALGGQLYCCEHCGDSHYSYHSCKNRHCPKCQNDQAAAWLDNQKSLLLPIPHFMVTFTLPDELSTARSNYAASCAGGGAPNLASSLALVYVHWMGFGC